jgi:hypothetical protein
MSTVDTTASTGRQKTRTPCEGKDLGTLAGLTSAIGEEARTHRCQSALDNDSRRSIANVNAGVTSRAVKGFAVLRSPAGAICATVPTIAAALKSAHLPISTSALR